MSQTELKQQLNQLSDKELEALAKRGKSIYNKRYRERNREKVKRAQQVSYAKIALKADAEIALAADAEIEGGVEVE